MGYFILQYKTKRIVSDYYAQVHGNKPDNYLEKLKFI